MIKIVDAICGSGKTTWVFEHMRSQDLGLYKETNND